MYSTRTCQSTPNPMPRFLSFLASSLVLVAVLAGSSFAEQPAVTGGVLAGNSRLPEQISDSKKLLDDAKTELEKLRRETRDLDERMKQIEDSAQIHVLGNEFARSLTDARRALPGPERFAATREARERLLLQTSDDSVRNQRELGKLGHAGSLLAAPIQSPGGDAAAIDTALGKQRDQLTRLGELQHTLLATLRAEELAERELEERVHAARTKLSQMLLWMPVAPGFENIASFVPALAWMGRDSWRAAGEALREAWAQQPVWTALPLFLAFVLLVLRRRLLRVLASHMPVASVLQRHRARQVAMALAITLALALPGPIVLRVAGMLLGSAPDAQPFPLALGETLVKVSLLLLALNLFTWLFDRRGMAVRYFGWDESSLAFLARTLRRFTTIFIPLMLIAALNGLENVPFAIRESIGRLLLFLLMITLAAFLVQIFRRRNPLMQNFIARKPRSWVVQFHALWFSLLIALPLAVSALAVAGYFVAAVYLFGNMVRSVFVVLGAVMIYGLMAMWVTVQRAHLERMKHEAAAPAEIRGGDIAVDFSRSADIATIGEEMRSLLNFVITLLLLGGLLSVWWSAIPTLSVIGNHELWTYSSMVGDKAVVHSLTVSGFFMAMLIGVITAVLVRNVGGVLDIALLKRFDMQADATYATKVMVRYVLVVIGIALASRRLGIGWSDVQWLVAALSVGLGFGLQEIFSNLVAGLIMLAERPVRIGDIVTVGDVTGTVARIRARATTLVDFDNKEILIPNKAFITDRITNWTLSNQTTRLLLKISAPRGNDVSLVQQVILDAVRSAPGVVSEHPPSVDFLGFSDNSLDFEISAYVDSFNKRSVVRNQINCAIELALRERRATS